MRITEIRERTVSIASPIANAFIDFSKMTCSVVAVVTDQMRLELWKTFGQRIEHGADPFALQFDRIVAVSELL